MKRSVIVLLIVVSLFLVSCGGSIRAGEDVYDTQSVLQQVRTGTQGVEVQLVPNYPPPVIYDLNEFVAIVEREARDV